ncbi:MAG: molybdenum cofactor guanylyltransferase [Bacteroidetes bacterium]|nr:molybdenum cofactor guanylyltransferase [Bacteroidota bacterium]
MVLLHGKPIIGYIVDEILKLSKDITIISANKQYDVFNCRRCEDLHKDIGPAAGISAALQCAANDLVFITSCDMPFIKAASILYLYEKSADFDITLYTHDQFIEPMFAIFRSCFAKWDAFLQKEIINYLTSLINLILTLWTHKRCYKITHYYFTISIHYMN